MGMLSGFGAVNFPYQNLSFIIQPVRISFKKKKCEMGYNIYIYIYNVYIFIYFNVQESLFFFILKKIFLLRHNLHYLGN